MNTPNTPEQNDAMSLLERRLAEIAARKQQQSPESETSSSSAAPAPAAAPPTPAPAAAAPVAPEAPAAAVESLSAASALTEGNLTSAETTSAEPEAVVPTEAAPVESAPVAEVEPATEPVVEISAPVADVAALPEMPAAASPEVDSEPMSVASVETPEAVGEAAPEMTTEATPADAPVAEATDIDDDSEGDDTVAAPVEFDNFESLDSTQMGKLILAAIQRPEALEQAKALIDRKRQYDARYDQDREEALKRFVAAGGDPAAFDRGDTAEHKAVERGWQQFRERRATARRQEEQQQLQNLTRKQELLGQLRELAESSNNTEVVAPKVKALQTAWRAVGPVPYKESKELWQTYDALLDRFYSQHNVTFELKDLDRRKNLEMKNALVARAEGLIKMAETNPGQAVKELRGLHEEWKQLGPVPQELREEIWNRFTAASDRVHGRRSEELASRRATEQEALTKKQALMTQLEALANYRSERIEDWRTRTDELQNLKQQWDAAGQVPRAQAQELNKRFWVNYKKFFQSKSAFFKALDEERNANVKRKEELIALAEQHQNDSDYGATREKYIQWQKEWKTIGPVPERLSQKLWNRFRTACNAFFERPAREAEQRQAMAAAKEAELNTLSAEKNTYLDQLAERLGQPEAGKAGTLEEYRELLAAWARFDQERGAEKVPVAPRVEERFFGLLGKYLDTVPELSYSQKQDLLFRQQLEQMKAATDAPQRFARREQDLRQTVNALENDIATLRTNLGFFARSKNADALRAEYEGRIQEAESRLEHAKQQLKTLRQVAPPLPPREPRFGDRDRDDRRGGRPGGGFGGGRR